MEKAYVLVWLLAAAIAIGAAVFALVRWLAKRIAGARWRRSWTWAYWGGVVVLVGGAYQWRLYELDKEEAASDAQNLENFHGSVKPQRWPKGVPWEPGASWPVKGS